MESLLKGIPLGEGDRVLWFDVIPNRQEALDAERREEREKYSGLCRPVA